MHAPLRVEFEHGDVLMFKDLGEHGTVHVTDIKYQCNGTAVQSIRFVHRSHHQTCAFFLGGEGGGGESPP